MTLADLRERLAQRFRPNLPLRFEDESGMLIGLEVADIFVAKNLARREDEEALVISLSGGTHAHRNRVSHEVPSQYGIS